MIGKKAIQDLPTFSEIQLRQVVSIEIQEIESIKDRLIRPAVPSSSAKGTLKSAKVRSPLLIQNDTGREPYGSTIVTKEGELVSPSGLL